MHPVHDHVDDALALLVQQFSNKARIRSVLGALATQVQALEYVLWDLHVERRLARATGAQLDGIGRLVDLSREGLAEETYRRYLRAQILLLKCNGTPEDLIAVVSALVGPHIDVALDEYRGALAALDLRGPLGDGVVDDTVTLLSKAKPAGVRVLVEASEAPGGFTFDSDDEAECFSDVHDPASAGGIFGSAQYVM
jgi:hypothetical protein